MATTKEIAASDAADHTGLRDRLRRVVVAGALVLVAGAAPSAAAIPADPEPAPDQRTEPAEPRDSFTELSASELVSALGRSRTAGTYIERGERVVAVTDHDAAEAVRDAGGTAKVVRYSTEQLEAVTSNLDEAPAIPGTAFGVDPSANRVSVTLDGTVSAAERERLESIVESYGAAVEVERVPGQFLRSEVEVQGGQGIGVSSAGGNCTLGFNVRRENSSDKLFLTAGHCADDGKKWYQNKSGAYLGERYRYKWGGDDYGVVDYKSPNVTARGTLTINGQKQDISGSRLPHDGEQVKRAGKTTDDSTGKVLVPSMTVTYNDGTTLTGVTQASLCAEKGDSGGPLFAGKNALGITSGSNFADDPSECRTYYQKVQPVLNKYNLEVY